MEAAASDEGAYPVAAPFLHRRRSTVDGGEGRGRAAPGLDAQYPGIRFRIVDEQDGVRPHIRFFVGGEMAPTIGAPVGPDQTCRSSAR